MPQTLILPVLYDLSVTIGSQLRLKPLLTRTLQRLLFHTSYSSGLVCLDLPAQAPAEAADPTACLELPIAAAVGDYALIARLGQPTRLPLGLFYGAAPSGAEAAAVLQHLGLPGKRYQAFVRLPLQQGVIVLLAVQQPESPFVLEQVLQPVLAQLSHAIVLCRTQDAQEEANRAAQDRMQQSLQLVEGQLQTLMELSPMGVALSHGGFITETNRAFVQLLGYADAGELRGRPLAQLVDGIALAASAQALAADQGPTQVPQECLGRRKDGSSVALLVSSRSVQTDQGERTFCYCIDLSEQKSAQQKLRSANDMLRMVLETAPLRIFWKDAELRYLGCNQAFARDAGLTRPEELLGKQDSELGWHAHAEPWRMDDLRVMQSQAPKLNYEQVQTHADGTQSWLRTSKVPLCGPQGEQLGILGLYDDITEHKRAQETIHQLAHFDALTGLANRQQLQQRLHLAMETCARTARTGALLFLDLDNFKAYNDTLGPAKGDQLLVDVGRRLAHCLGQAGLLARPGGDEFIVLLEGLPGAAREAATEAERMAEQMRSALAEPPHLEVLQAQITASIGIVLFKDDRATADTLLKHADAAMYQAKAAGRNHICFFDARMQSELEERIALAADLAHAQERGQLQLFFQKQVNSMGRVTGAEVLLRWAHPQRGLVSPAHFIPLAEESGAIVPIGMWVLQTACQQLRRWQSQPLLRELTLAVNVSAKQFHRADFVEAVRHVLVQTGARPSNLKLELTESIVLEHVEDTITKMRELKLLGLGFSMDDFGTGYSSLQYLKRLPLDQLKIDQSFVRDIASDPNDAAIVQTIIAMTDALGLNVIAEGVETVSQQQFLEQRGCHAFQGYLFGKPVPQEAFEQDVADAATR